MRPAAQPAAAPSADLLLVNGRVYTLDPARPWTDAIAISGSRIAAVGTRAEVRRAAALGITRGLGDEWLRFITRSPPAGSSTSVRDRFGRSDTNPVGRVCAWVRGYAPSQAMSAQRLMPRSAAYG